MPTAASWKRSAELTDEELWDARDRKRLGTRCATAMYVSIAAIPCLFFVSWLVAVVLAAAGIVMAATGLVGLRNVGPGPAPEAAKGGAQRLASRLARTAPAKARVAIWCGACVLGAIALLVAAAALKRG